MIVHGRTQPTRRWEKSLELKLRRPLGAFASPLCLIKSLEHKGGMGSRRRRRRSRRKRRRRRRRRRSRRRRRRGEEPVWSPAGS